MLTSLASALVLGLLLQDAPATEAPTSDPKAESLLKECESQLYSPVDEGLKSLAFDIVMPSPMGEGRMGTVHVEWSADGAASAAFEIDDAMFAGMPADQVTQMKTMMASQVGPQMKDTGEQIAAIQTNRMMSSILKKMTVRLEGTQDGLVKVVARPRPGHEGQRQEQVLLLDEEGLVQRTHEKVKTPMGVVEQDQTMTWETIEGSDKLVLASIDSKTRMGDQTTNFVRERMGKFLLVTRLDITTMGKSQAVVLENFVVNGTPVGKAAAEGGSQG